ncbi:ABC transporter ATP-binding protein [Ectothiorhodospira lacustris]|uniref:ABC transporter ATP-binding protein n=1 Tax=Ectothiorhodospira lacustris TaxID=2899127 RepID=UPI001EE96326|nr:ABC transporter ATP-binding protein [Ectothiorhodospira lacustris]MCG5500274.1 ABC transporter ATP-binding protein [Ectothiorhodospira lacustris]
MSTPLLSATGLMLRYGAHGPPVFSGVDISIQPREIVALLGESGCGKSSLLSVLAGLGHADGGEVLFRGRPVRRTPSQVAVVFQDPCLLPWLSVSANARFGLGFRNLRLPRSERRTRVSRVLADVGLDGWEKAYPHQLSGGMAQRLALARALGRHPSLILLDEPFSALDALTREAMQDLLTRLVHQHASAAFLVTHDIDEALRVADRILLMGGSPAQIMGEWHLLDSLGPPPRRRHGAAALQLRETILQALGHHRCRGGTGLVRHPAPRINTTTDTRLTVNIQESTA